MAFDKGVIPRLMDAVFGRTRAFLEQETNIIVNRAVPSQGDVDMLFLHDMTAIVGLGGHVNALIAFSFEQRLLEAIFAAYTADIEVPENDRELYMRETSAEVVNIIAGHCTTDAARHNHLISLSPPIILQEARHIARPKSAVFASMRLETLQGVIDVSFVGPRELFDEHLNQRT